MKRVAKVSLGGNLAGLLTEENGRTSFAYNSEWLARPGAAPVSLTLPLRPEPYTHHELHPFFENLLPEGWLLDVAARKLKISKNDSFGLLMATCADCIGAVEIEPASPAEAAS